MERRGGSDWKAYLAPYAVFLLLVETAARAPDSWTGALLLAKVVLPGALLVFYVARGAFPELRGYRIASPGILLDVALGVVIAALWVGPFLLFPDLPRPEPSAGFDPEQLGPDARALALGVRAIGFALVTPFVEELFVRSFVMRMADVIDQDLDFARIPVARFTARSFLVTVLWFTFTHLSWEWGVAFVTGLLLNLWLYRRRHVAACIVAHATANASIWLAVVFGPADLGIFL